MRRYTLGLNGREFVIDVQELTADRFDVVIADQHYEVTLTAGEDLDRATIAPGLSGGDGVTGTLHAAKAPAHAAPPAAAASAASANPARGAQASGALNAPMPGVILELHVKPGDMVQRGQQIAVLEAMKMHNVIGAPRAGTIVEICVKTGQTVGHGDPIVRFTVD